MAGGRSRAEGLLYERLYNHHRVTRMTQKADRIMTRALSRSTCKSRGSCRRTCIGQSSKEKTMPRVVADYIAGMTDRFALDEYKKLFDPYEKV